MPAGRAGNVSGFRIGHDRLSALAGSARSLGLHNTSPPFFLSSPAQVGFTPTGGQLVVATKNNGVVDVFAVDSHGLLSDQPVSTAVGGAPFAFRFAVSGRLVLVDADASAVGTYIINRQGALVAVGAPVTDGQTAACWIAAVRGFDYVANTGSGTISQYATSRTGRA